MMPSTRIIGLRILTAELFAIAMFLEEPYSILATKDVQYPLNSYLQLERPR